MSFLQSLILGILQGLTEFLPISSSGHLVLGAVLLGLRENHLLFDLVVHGGTLCATALFFWKDLRPLLFPRDNASRRLVVLLIVGTIPAGLVGVLFEDALESLFATPKLVAAMLMLTGVVLLGTRAVAPGGKGLSELSTLDAMLIGVAQAAAIVPGISRSGSTIAAALFLGVARDPSARFSFLLSLPAIGGAFLLKLRDLSAVDSSMMVPMAVGFIASLLTGILALTILMPLVRLGRFYYFSTYLLPVGALGVVLL